MKTLLLLGCAFCLGACGDGGNGTGTYQGPGQLGNESQTPQTPSDSVPATNSQSPALNDQAPPLNSQQPVSGSSAPTSTIDCDSVAAAVQASGCNVSNAQMADCLNFTAVGTACATQVQAMLACMLGRFVCENGLLDFSEACAAELVTLGTCVEDLGSASTCSLSSSCAFCEGTCATCQCDAQLDPTLNCSQLCNNN